MADALPDGIGMYLMMIFLAIAVIGMIMAIKNRIAMNKTTDLVKDGKLRDQLDDIQKMRKRPSEPKWDNTTIDLGKGKGSWEKLARESRKTEKPKESIDKLIDKLDEDKKDD